jgi:oligoendopeptidase F
MVLILRVVVVAVNNGRIGLAAREKKCKNSASPMQSETPGACVRPEQVTPRKLMDRRTFLHTAGLTTAVAALAGRQAVAAPAAKPAAVQPEPVKKLPTRSEVPASDTWDLSSLFADDKAWEKAFEAWSKQIQGYAQFQGKLAESADTLARALQFDLDVERMGERLGTYAMLRSAEDQTQSAAQRMQGRYVQAASLAAQAASFVQPELLAIPAARMEEMLKSSVLAPYKLLLERVLRYRPHTLGEKEEKLLAMQTEMAEAAGRIFRQLNDADLKFGTVRDEDGQAVELSHGTFMSLLYSPSGDVRRAAFKTYYKQYMAHAHTLAASLNASIQRDVYYAKVRNYPSALEASLFPDQVPVSVYENLIASVHRQLPALHHYYDVRRRKMGLKEIHHYDTYVPILSKMQSDRTWDQAVELVLNAVKPLGDEYGRVLAAGLAHRWCDRYENLGKQSGAFSAGSFDGQPYILMNYQPDVLDHVFTLAHEAGHSMHSYFSAKTQPFAYYDYPIFVAEVASTFNEQLLSNYLLAHARSKLERAYLLNRQIDAIRATIFRQTMFAEFEKLTHASTEAGEPLTLDRIKGIYHQLLAQYFGPKFQLDPELDVECLRVPHFYRAFYVYKYATGMSAAMALVDRVTHGGRPEVQDYLNFLSGGCSKDPLDLLRGAGVDMEKPERVDQDLGQFAAMVKELETLI